MALIYECNKTCYEKQSLRHRIEKKVISEPIPQFRNKILRLKATSGVALCVKLI